ncbi:transcriptional regulator GcvA [Luteimonas aquatica]|uniref:transcriptional regulator GcvA n=1 Tax=Luteimonas aquatica TaxID=450364 RepID=UPI001F59E991|nr:transcriptional regulator GcvA [Luteimonas aquatica]
MRKLPPLTALRAFEAAARHASFKQAAEELALSPTAISHQVRQLEERLGLALFERRTRQVALTEAGERLYPVLREGFDAIATTWAALRTPAARPAVTLTTTRAFAARWLVPRLGAFAQALPEIALRVHAADEPVDLRREGVDLAVRYGGGRYPGLHAQPLLPGRFAPVCSPLLALHDTAQLHRHPLLRYAWHLREADTPDWPRWLREAGLDPTAMTEGPLFSDETHAVQAAIAGQGVVLASLPLVADELAAGRLRVPFGPVLAGHSFHLVWTPEADAAPALARVRDWLHAAAQASLDNGLTDISC